MILPERLKRGDIIGVVAPSNPVIDENIEEVKEKGLQRVLKQAA